MFNPKVAKLLVRTRKSTAKSARRKSPGKRRRKSLRRDLSLRGRRFRAVWALQVRERRQYLHPPRLTNLLPLKLRMRKKRRKLKSFLERPSLQLLKRLQAPKRPRPHQPNKFRHLNLFLRLNKSKHKLKLLKYRLKYKDWQFKHHHLPQSKLLLFLKFLLLLIFLRFLRFHWVLRWDFLLEFLLQWVAFPKETFLPLSNNNSFTNRCSCSSRCMLRCNNNYFGSSNSSLLKAVQVFLNSTFPKLSQDSQVSELSPASQEPLCLASLQDLVVNNPQRRKSERRWAMKRIVSESVSLLL
jgi:hypothetical protein